MSGALLMFDPVPHVYRVAATGQRVPSVTEILRSTGMSTDFEALRYGSRGEAIDAKRELGQIVHTDAHAYDDDDLDWSTLHPDVEPYIAAWATFRHNQRLAPVTRERMVYDPTLGYCGTLDGIFRRDDGRIVLVDIKTGDPESAACRFQTEAYRHAFSLEHPDITIHERLGVWLRPDQKVPYTTFPYTEWRDRDIWRSILTTFYNGQAGRRLA